MHDTFDVFVILILCITNVNFSGKATGDFVIFCNAGFFDYRTVCDK